MAVSIRAKGRLLGFIISRGGRVTSGRNDSLPRWVFGHSSKQSYTNERIDEMVEVFEALEADGVLVLERDDRGKLFAAHLADDADLQGADFEMEMFTSPDQVWVLVGTLQSIIARLRNELNGSDIKTALELASDAESRAQLLAQQLDEARARIDVLELQALSVQQPAGNDEALAEANRRLATAQSRIKTLTEAYEAAVERRKSETDQIRRDKDSEITSLSEQLAAAIRTAKSAIGIIGALQSVLEEHGFSIEVIDIANV